MLNSWEIIIGMIVAVGGLYLTYLEFRKSNKIKRTEFLEKLITEFNEEKTYVAKKLLDDFWFDKDIQNPYELKELSAQVFIANGSKKEKKGLPEELKIVLRDHKDDKSDAIGQSEQLVRESFDQLLDFFTKLDYYLSLKVISKTELRYFEYYIERCNTQANGGVMIYAKAYGYNALFRLFYVMKQDKEHTKLIPNDIFISNRQKEYYRKLRNK